MFFTRYPAASAVGGPVISLSVSRLRCAKMAGRIDILVGVETLGDPRHIGLDTGPNPPTARAEHLMQSLSSYFVTVGASNPMGTQ